MRKTVVPNLYSNAWYNGDEVQTWQELLQIDDRVSIRCGVARLRQLRIKEGQQHPFALIGVIP